jgi:hypothetical protein
MNQFNSGSALDALCSLSMANVIGPINDELASAYAEDAQFQAEALGYHSPDSGVPRLFQDEKLLINPFEAGQQIAHSFEETQNCKNCQNACGDPCHTHG